jgi:2-methylcitrate dehydratase
MILDEHDLEPDEIVEITHMVKETRRTVIDNNPLRSQNAQYIMAMAVVERQIRWDDFLRDRREEPAIGAMAQKTRLMGSDELADSPAGAPAIVEVRTADGRTFRERVDYRKGHSENPLSQEELETKFVRLAMPAVGERQALEIMALVQRLDEVSDVRELIELMH